MRLRVIYSNDYEPVTAVDYYKNALQNNANDIDTLKNLAKLYVNTGQFSNAIDIYKRLSEIDSLDKSHLLNMGKLLMSIGDYPQAEQVLVSFAKKNSTMSDCYNYLGLAQFRQSKLNEAALSLNQAIKLSGERPIYHYNLSQVYTAMGEKKKSTEEFNKAVTMQPHSLQDMVDLSKIYYDKGSAEYSAKYLNEAIKMDSKNELLYVSLSSIYINSGDTEMAKTTIQKLIKIVPNAKKNPSVKKQVDSLGIKY